MTTSQIRHTFQKEYFRRTYLTHLEIISPKPLKRICYHWFLKGAYYQQGASLGKKTKNKTERKTK